MAADGEEVAERRAWSSEEKVPRAGVSSPFFCERKEGSRAGGGWGVYMREEDERSGVPRRIFLRFLSLVFLIIDSIPEFCVGGRGEERSRRVMG